MIGRAIRAAARRVIERSPLATLLDLPTQEELDALIEETYGCVTNRTDNEDNSR